MPFVRRDIFRGYAEGKLGSTMGLVFTILSVWRIQRIPCRGRTKPGRSYPERAGQADGIGEAVARAQQAQR